MDWNPIFTAPVERDLQLAVIDYDRKIARRQVVEAQQTKQTLVASAACSKVVPEPTLHVAQPGLSKA